MAIASALNWYLKEQVKTYEEASWSALPPLRGLPAALPAPAEKRRIVRPVRFRWDENGSAFEDCYRFLWLHVFAYCKGC